RLVPRVGPTEPAAGEAAEMGVGTDDHDRLAALGGPDRRDDRRAGAAVDDDVAFDRFVLRRERREGKADEQGENDGDGVERGFHGSKIGTPARKDKNPVCAEKNVTTFFLFRIAAPEPGFENRKAGIS